MVCCIDLQRPGWWRVKQTGHSFLLVKCVLYSGLGYTDLSPLDENFLTCQKEETDKLVALPLCSSYVVLMYDDIGPLIPNQ